MTDATIDVAAGALRVTWPDGATAAYPFAWLRDNCPSGLDARTGERVFDLLSAPAEAEPESVEAAEGRIALRWRGEDHVSVFDAEWLATRRPGARRPDPAAIAPELWRGDLDPARLPRTPADALAADPAAFRAWLAGLKRMGAALVEGLADDPEAGVDLARRIGPLRDTYYGAVFDVTSKRAANSIAYSAAGLTPHTDLPYEEQPPGVQFLHCLRNDAEGGGSTLADGFTIAEAIRAESPEAFALLADTPIPFRSCDPTTDLRRSAPVIGRGPDGRAAEIRWSVAIADVFDMGPERLQAYYAAYRRFMAMSRDPVFLISLRLAPGEMLVFDNRRMLHGREAFNPATGERRLRGCYVDSGSLDSRLRVLSGSRAA